MPSQTMTPIAPASPRPDANGQAEGDDAVDAESGSDGDGVVGDESHRDGHHRGHECRGRRGGGQERLDLFGRGAFRQRGAQDARVHGDDVDHHHERGHAGLDLGAERRAALGKLKVGSDRFHPLSSPSFPARVARAGHPQVAAD